MKAAPHPLSAEMRPLTLRDLGWLTASLVIVIAPHALRAPWWLTLLTLCLYGWRFYSTINRAPLPSRWLVIAVAGIGLLGVWMEYRTLFGRQAGVILLMLFSGLKLLESRTHRDGAVAAFLGYFLIITNFLYTQSIPTALIMCVGVFIITATLVGFSAPQRALRANLRTTGLMLLHAAPAALVLFVLFPRVQGPLWGLRCDRVSRRVRGRIAAAAAALLARTGAVGLRRAHLVDRRELPGPVPRAAGRQRTLPVLGNPGSAQPLLDVRPRDRREPARALAHDLRWPAAVEYAGAQPPAL